MAFGSLTAEMPFLNHLLGIVPSSARVGHEYSQREARGQTANKQAHYTANAEQHAYDEDVVERLYDAAAAGVKIDIVLRGNCSLMPSNVDNMHVVGIIDRYLEHSRILIFANGGTPRYYMGSADWMPRNLVNRVEVLTPVYDEDLQRDLARTVDYGLRDTTNGRIVDGFGKNEMQQGEPFRSQEHLYVDYLKESQEYNNIRN